MSNESTSSKFLESTFDAINPLNILIRLITLFVFVVMSAFPYLIKNGNEAFKEVAGASIGVKILSFFKVLGQTSFKGMMIGFSTIWDTFLNFNTVIAESQYMTLFYVAIVVFAGVFVIYQPLSIIFNILDMKKGKHYSKALAVIVSFILLVVVASPVSYIVTDGQTITSGIIMEEEIDFGINDTIINQTEMQDEFNDIIDMVNINGSG